MKQQIGHPDTIGQAGCRTQGWPSTEEDQDVALVARCLNGDNGAFSLLVERYEQRLGAVISRVIHNPDDAEDVLQETLVRAYKGLPRYRQDGPFAAWLYRIALNVVRNHRKQAWVRRVVSLEACLEEKERGEAGNEKLGMQLLSNKEGRIEEIVLRREENQQIGQALRQLPEKYRLPILLHYFDGRTGEEIAQILGIASGTVWSRIHFGLTKLRAMLETYFVPTEH